MPQGQGGPGAHRRVSALSRLLPGYVNCVHIQETALQGAVAQLSHQDLASLDLRGSFAEVARVLRDLCGADGAGILVVDDTHVLRYLASTDSSAQLLEAVQESTGRGPCVHSLVTDEAVVVPDILEDRRWPDIGQVLAANGVRAIIGVPIRVGGVPVGSVNVYCAQPRQWDETDARALTTIEALAGRLLSGALFAERQEAVIAQLQRALEARVMVERAVGVLMAVEDVDAAAAFERIRRAARSSRRPVRDVSADVVEWKKLP